MMLGSGRAGPQAPDLPNRRPPSDLGIRPAAGL